MKKEFIPIFNPDNLPIEFVCTCGGKLKFEDGGKKMIYEEIPDKIGTVCRVRRKMTATCNNCGKITYDYFT